MSDTNDSLTSLRGNPASDGEDASRAEPSNPKFSFATFNILHARRPHGRVDLPAFAGAVASLDADVVALQEVDRRMLRSRWADLTSIAQNATSMQGSFGAARRRYDLGFYGNALLSRTPLSEVVVRRLMRTSWRHERRVAVLASVELGGQKWRIGATHLSSRREESEPQLRSLLSELDGHDGPAVLMGDLNRRTEEVIPLAEELGWQAIVSGNTYPVWDPSICLDYVLTRNCTAITAAVRRMTVSDHCALIVEVQP